MDTLHTEQSAVGAGARRLPGRAVLAVAGADARGFLQGLITNDVRQVAADRAVYALFLTPQGKFLHELFVVEGVEDGAPVLLLDTQADRAADLLRRLTLYKLRAKVTISDASDRWGVAVDPTAAKAESAPPVGTARALAGGVAYTDPRHAGLGLRLLLPRGRAAALPEAGADYETRRLELTVPDGNRDLIPEKSIPLENGMDTLNAVSFDKGCYMGQELTARTHYRALIRRRLMTVRAVDGAPLPPPGTPVILAAAEGGEAKEVGEMRTSLDGLGLALLRIEDVEQAGDRPLLAGGVAIRV